jgi:hypothetical protein
MEAEGEDTTEGRLNVTALGAKAQMRYRTLPAFRTWRPAGQGLNSVFTTAVVNRDCNGKKFVRIWRLTFV